MTAETVSIVARPDASSEEFSLLATLRRGAMSPEKFAEVVRRVRDAYAAIHEDTKVDALLREDAPRIVEKGVGDDMPCQLPELSPKADFALLDSLRECVFVVESVAHLQGKERLLLPMADRARAILAHYGDPHSVEWMPPPAHYDDWSCFHGDGKRHGYQHAAPYGTFHVNPAHLKNGAPNGYTVQFTNEKGAVRDLAGLWTDVGSARSPIEACKIARDFWSQKVAPAQMKRGGAATAEVGEAGEAAKAITVKRGR
jgi:hypothetical protein